MTPDRLQVLSLIAIFVGLALSGLGGFGVFHFGKKIANPAEAELRENVNKLQTGNQKLETELAPFEKVAKEMHPSLGRDEALRELGNGLGQMKEHAVAFEHQSEARSFSDQQRTIAVQILTDVGWGLVTLSAVKGDQEAMQLANALLAVFNEAGWAVQSNAVNEVLCSAPVKGVKVVIKQNPPSREAQAALAAFTQMGIAANGSLDPKQLSDGIVVVVGSKP